MNKSVVTRSDLNEFATRRVAYWLKKFSLTRGLRSLGATAGTWVEVAIVSKKVSQELNEAYRDTKAPTDILSFATVEIFRSQGVLGELVICAPIWLAQAKKRQISWKQEGDILLVHGLLHLLGLDHEESELGKEAMLKWERKFLGRHAGLIERAHETTIKSKWLPKHKKTSLSRRTKSAKP